MPESDRSICSDTFPLRGLASLRLGVILLPIYFFSGLLPAAEIDFDRQVASLIVQKCLVCHDSREHKGGLDLSSKAPALKGGESGVVLVPGKPGDSYLWDRIASDEMPPKHPLSDDQKSLIKTWIEQGAKWGTDPIDPFAFTTDARAGYDWWSLQKLTKPAIPQEFASETGNPIDAFIRRRLSEKKLVPSAPADRRTLICRLSFDLIGLPPTPEEVEAFVADQSPDAYERLVDRLLQSPHYGERWARHWLDLARFGESQGFERDKIRENAWPYRDWVIEALNNDLPYDEFVRQQLAGDALHPDDAASITATGFLVAAPYDEVGQSQQSAAMRAVVRQDELEDIVGTVGQTFLGLTVNCARCHDHKFDPIKQKEYYQLVAALAGVRHGERKVNDPEQQKLAKKLQQEWFSLRQKIAARFEETRKQILSEKSQSPRPAPPQPIARWSFDLDFRDEIGELNLTPVGGAMIEQNQLVLNGNQSYAKSVPLTTPLAEKTLEAWVQVGDLKQRGGGVLSVQSLNGNVFDGIVFGEQEPRKWMAGSNGFVRTKSFDGPDESDATKAPVHIAIVYQSDGTILGYRNGEPYGKPYKSSVLQKYQADQTQVLLGLRHGTSAGGNRMFQGSIDMAQLYDRALSPDEIAASAGRTDYIPRKTLLAEMSDSHREEISAWETEVASLANRIGNLQNPRVYAVVPKQPEPTHLLLRGNTTSPAEEVVPRGISSLAGLSPEFGLAGDSAEAERRQRLADWITSPDNPLFARVIVNRLWHYHFGIGIVDSPNDFGFNGGRPTHPELLDFLASSLIEKGYNLKAIHRLIVTSETYRQASKPREECLAVDADNRLLWRFAPQRLEAEVLRDTILKVSGQLNPQIGGPPFRDFETFNFNSQFYVMQDKVGPEFNRRTIYRMWIRSGRNGFLDAFDCPDPSTTAPKRAVTTTPTQSLSLLNNSFVLRMADNLAERVSKNEPDRSQQIVEVYRQALQRTPTDAELVKVEPFVEKHGLAAFVRILFNSNEFVFVE